MIIALYCVAAAMILGGTYSAMSGWEIVIIERGWTQVLAGVIVATGGVLLAGIGFLTGEIRQMAASLARQPAPEMAPAAIARPSADTGAPDDTARRAEAQSADARMPDPGALPLAAGAITAAGAVAAHTQLAQDEADSTQDDEGATRTEDIEKAERADDAVDAALSAEEPSNREEAEVSRATAGDATDDAPGLASDAGITPELDAPEDATPSDAEIFADLLAGQIAGAEEDAPRDISEPEALQRDETEATEAQPEAPQLEKPEGEIPAEELVQQQPQQEELAEDADAPAGIANEEFPEGDVVERDSGAIAPDAEPADEASKAPPTPNHAEATESEADAAPGLSLEAAKGPDAGISADEEAPEATPEEPVVAPEDLAVPPPSVIGTYESGGNTYTMYSDGSIDAQTPDGDYHFASLDELKRFIAEGGESGHS